MTHLSNIIQLLIFFIFFQKTNIYYSIIIIININIINILYYKIKNYKKEYNFYIKIIIIILAILTIILQNESFIKWKLTVTYLIIGLLIIINSKNEKNLLIKNLIKNTYLPKKTWIKLNYSWGIFFILIAIINIFISYKFNIKIWVYFKIFGITISIIFFFLIQIIYIKICKK